MLQDHACAERKPDQSFWVGLEKLAESQHYGTRQARGGWKLTTQLHGLVADVA